MDELARRNELVKAMAASELALPVVQEELSIQTYSKVPLSRIAALGTGLEPIAAAVQQVVSGGQAVSGYYKVAKRYRILSGIHF